MEFRAVAFDVGHTLIDEQIDAASFVLPIRIMPHVYKILPQIGLPMAAWSNTRSAREADVRNLLEAAGIAKFFSWVITSVDAGCRKPHPGFFRFALGKCGLAEKEVLFVGNQLNTDICGGLQCDIKTVWLSGEAYRSPEDTTLLDSVSPDYVIESLAELPALLKRIQTLGNAKSHPDTWEC
ncbi:MAG TPA: HAD family hydrolase [Terriglobales bacterium]|nr:HAD family hydrolase [Terriglobales bacterium]